MALDVVQLEREKVPISNPHKGAEGLVLFLVQAYLRVKAKRYLKTICITITWDLIKTQVPGPPPQI